MDKELKKKILYRPDMPISKSVEPTLKREQKDTYKPTQKNIYNGKKLSDWIKKSDLINRAALCKKSKIDRANLDKFLLKGEIPLQHISSLVEILKNYGYAE